MSATESALYSAFMAIWLAGILSIYSASCKLFFKVLQINGPARTLLSSEISIAFDGTGTGQIQFLVTALSIAFTISRGQSQL